MNHEGIIQFPRVILHSEISMCLEVNLPQSCYPHKTTNTDHKTKCASYQKNNFTGRNEVYISFPIYIEVWIPLLDIAYSEKKLFLKVEHANTNLD